MPAEEETLTTMTMKVRGNVRGLSMPVVATILGCLLAACQPTTTEKTTSTDETSGGGAVIARYAGKTFTEGDLKRELERMNPRARESLSDLDRRRQFVENRVLSDLIYEEGRKKGLDRNAEIQRQVRDMERRLVIQKVMQEHQSAPVSDEEIRAYYDAHKQEFSTDTVRASHILVKDEKLARDILSQLRKDPSRFEELAAKYSIDKSNAKNGGDLGEFGRGRMVKEFEDAAFGLSEDGQISDIVHTRFGYHIIKRTGRKDGVVRPFDSVKNQIRIRLINEKRRSQTEKFLEELKKQAGYQLDEKALAAVDLDVGSKKSSGKRRGGSTAAEHH